MRLSHVVGTRPNFVKAAPVIRALGDIERVEQRVIHTGQHYDPAMSDNIMRDVGMRQPDANLGIGSGSHAAQTAAALVALEKDFIEHPPEMVFVYGDVNSTLAGALAASKMNIPIAHVEAGLRSFDREMPEEINRIVVDSVSDLLFVTSEDATENLAREGVPDDKIFFVGNTMIDSIAFAEEKWLSSPIREELGIDRPFGFVTLHRPSNVDNPERLGALVQELQELSQSLHIIFPVHPRTRPKFESAGLFSSKNLTLVEPVSYIDSIRLISEAALVITDSGGVQEESTYLGTPCLTPRASTERPITLSRGTNRLVRLDEIAHVALEVLGGEGRWGEPIRLWDGHAASRVVEVFQRLFVAQPTELPGDHRGNLSDLENVRAGPGRNHVADQITAGGPG
jgi:UDP-N-acetylglucosamine 2-epimerase (non-hydrolysing)